MDRETYMILVIEDNHTKKVVGTGAVILEYKFIRELGRCAHMEDVIVDETYRGKKLG